VRPHFAAESRKTTGELLDSLLAFIMMQCSFSGDYALASSELSNGSKCCPASGELNFNFFVAAKINFANQRDLP
jgi:hypothetical protein